MPSYSDLDSDAERLPEGMTRTGYDADTQIYTYTDSNGRIYEGLPGNRYGHLRPTGSRVENLRPMGYDTAANADGQQFYRQMRNADWKYLAPLFLIIGVFLLVVLRFIFSSANDGGLNHSVPQCREGYETYLVRHGDTCWGIAQRFAMTLDQLKKGFEEAMALDCEKLRPGQRLCVLESRA